MNSSDYRYDGYQFGLEPEDGCHNFTILKPGKSKGASFCITGPEGQMPSHDEIVARIKEKDVLFSTSQQ